MIMKNNASGTTKYFQGQMCDEKGSCRVVGFDAKIHKKLKEFHEKHAAVALGNCEVKEGRVVVGWRLSLETVLALSILLQSSKLQRVNLTKVVMK